LSPPAIAGGESGDTASTDTTTIDTTRAGGELDTIVTYSADQVDFTFHPRLTVLTGDARLGYKTMELSAHRIEVNWDENMLFAEGRLDTVQRDSSEGGGDTLVWRGLPKMRDGEEVVEGHRLVYHLRTRRGRIIRGVTAYEDGLTRGQTIKKVDKDVLNIRSGTYTTCDAPQPHYHFWGRDLKLIVKDKVVARPVVLYFGPVPVAIFPFGVFPAKGGRHSGLIIPTYGESAGQGRYFRNLGYYWAPNDYFDIRGSLDFFERYGTLFTVDSRYAKRYIFSGNLNGSLINMRYEDRVDNRWWVRLNHGHQLSPTTSLNISADYQSDASFRKDLSHDLHERMKREIRSDATLTKRWQGTPYSGSINLHHEESLTTGEVTQWLPQLHFNRSNSPLFPQKEGDKPEEAAWYNQLFYGYRFEGKNRRKVDIIDSTYWDKGYYELPELYRSGIRHNLSFSAPLKPLKYIVLKPNLNYTEGWFDEWLTFTQRNNMTIDTVKHKVEYKNLRARRTFDTRLSLNTTLYGLFHPRVLGLEAVRHKLDPSLTFTYKPDFSEPRWGYFDVFEEHRINPATGDTLPTGRKLYYDRFGGNLFGSTSRTEVKSLGLSLNNLFQYKRLKGDKEVKGELFTLNLSSSHNFAADSLRWGNLSSYLTARPNLAATGAGGLQSMISGFSINLRGTHSFYTQAVDDNGRLVTVNRVAPGGLRLVKFDVSTSCNLKSGRGAAQRDTIETEGLSPESGGDWGWQPGPGPWDAGLSFHYSENHSDPANISKNITSSLNFNLQVTRNWKVTYNTNFDLDRRRVTMTNISIHRDLHCWEGMFNWTPLGAGKGFYMRISVKSAQLRDVKVERQKGRGSLLGF